MQINQCSVHEKEASLMLWGRLFHGHHYAEALPWAPLWPFLPHATPFYCQNTAMLWSILYPSYFFIKLVQTYNHNLVRFPISVVHPKIVSEEQNIKTRKQSFFLVFVSITCAKLSGSSCDIPLARLNVTMVAQEQDGSQKHRTLMSVINLGPHTGAACCLLPSTGETRQCTSWSFFFFMQY